MSDPASGEEPQARRFFHKWLRRGVTALGTALAAGLLWLGWLGAFGGPLYTDLPGHGLVANSHPDVAAVIFSGDMGFKFGMAQEVGIRLAKAGIPVTGVNSLVHFRTRRDRAEIRAFVEAAMAHAMKETGAHRLILIGQSYGADMLHIGLASLPPAERRPIAFVALVVPTDTIYFQISPGEYFEWAAPDAQAVTSARALDWVPALCVRGQEESNSLCPMLHQPNMAQVALPGGHPLRRDADQLTATLLDRIGGALVKEGHWPLPE